MKKQVLYCAWAVLMALCCVACGDKNGKMAGRKAGDPATTEAAAGVAQQQNLGEAPDFTLNDLQGKPLTLKSLRGKYVVLDFWGSWCGWCIKGMPKMKEYYQKYAGKLEIVGIDCGDSEEAWHQAVEQHQLPWLHVYCPEGAPVLKDYDIQGFPTKVVVNPDGDIIKLVIGEDPAFYTFLDQILG